MAARTLCTASGGLAQFRPRVPVGARRSAGSAERAFPLPPKIGEETLRGKKKRKNREILDNYECNDHRGRVLDSTRENTR